MKSSLSPIPQGAQGQERLTEWISLTSRRSCQPWAFSSPRRKSLLSRVLGRWTTVVTVLRTILEDMAPGQRVTPTALGMQTPICLREYYRRLTRQSLNMVTCIPLSQCLDDVISFPSLCFHTEHHFLGLLCCLHLSSLYTSHHRGICLNLFIFSVIAWNSLPASKLSFVFKIVSTHVSPLIAKVKIYLQTSLPSDFE